MQKPFSIEFSNGLTATAIYPVADADLSAIIAHLGLCESRPTISLVGGASKLSDADREQLRSLFIEVLAPFAESLNAYVVDGGTDAGIMQMMGQARCQIGGTFPLIGVTTRGLATLPNQPPPAEDACALEPNHTHFVIVPGGEWGDESPWLAAMAMALAGDCPRVTVLMNGGEITWKDARESIRVQQPILAIAGSGRTADILVAALQETVTDDRARELVQSGLVRAIDLRDPQQLAEVLDRTLTDCDNNSLHPWPLADGGHFQ